MSPAYWINAGMYITAVVFSIILFIGAFLSRKLKGSVFRWFFYLALIYLFSMVFEGIIWLLEGTPGNTIRIILKTADYLSSITWVLASIMFALYLCDYLSIKTKQTRQPVYITCALCSITFLASTISQFGNTMVWFDENNYYQTTEHYWMMYIGPVSSFLICVALILWHIKALKPREWISLLSYFIVPLVCYTVDMVTELWIASLSLTVVLMLIYITIQVDLMHKVEEQNTLLAESRISVMLSQIQPHFLYNSLTAIQELCVEDPQTARQMINEFSVYLRGNLDSLTLTKPIPFERELKHVETYLSLEKKRFGDKLQVKYNISARDFTLPSLTLQPVVENAVRHGVTKRAKGGMVTISASETQAAYVITVEDDGVGFDYNEKLRMENGELKKDDGCSHIGIDNVRSRLSSMCGGTLEIQSMPGEGTTVVITIPKGNFNT